MLTARKVVLAAIVFFSITMTYRLFTPSDRDRYQGMGSDSYGVYPRGYMGLYDLLQAIGCDVTRTFSPVRGDESTQQTLILLQPNRVLLNHEPVHVRRCAEWVKRGGNLFVACVSDRWPIELLQELGLDELQALELSSGDVVSQLDADVLQFSDAVHVQTRKPRKRERELDETTFSDSLDWIMGQYIPDTYHWQVAGGDGDWADIKADVEEFVSLIPTSGAIDLGETEPIAAIRAKGDADAERVIAARFAVGKGSVTLLADASVLSNYSLRESDSSVLAFRLLGDGSSPLLIDEFFHGLNVRGDPLWLFSQPGYRLVSIAVLVATLLVVWRFATALGPVSASAHPPRRTLREYLESMSRMYGRLKGRHDYLRSETLQVGRWWLLHQLQLAPNTPDELAYKRLECLDPELAEEYSSACREFERSALRRMPAAQYLTCLQRIYRCHSKINTRLSRTKSRK